MIQLKTPRTISTVIPIELLDSDDGSTDSDADVEEELAA